MAFDTIGLVWEVAGEPKWTTMHEFVRRAAVDAFGEPRHWGSRDAVFYHGFDSPWGYLQIKSARRDCVHIVLERGYGQRFGGADVDSVRSVVADVAEAFGIAIGEPRLSRVDLVRDTTDKKVLATARELVPPPRSRMVLAEYRDAKTQDVETVFYRNKSRALRVYDKAAEQGVDGDWVRVEHQLRKRWVERLFPGRRIESLEASETLADALCAEWGLRTS